VKGLIINFCLNYDLKYENTVLSKLGITN
jgi:hypothetical protein